MGVGDTCRTGQKVLSPVHGREISIPTSKTSLDHCYNIIDGKWWLIRRWYSYKQWLLEPVEVGRFARPSDFRERPCLIQYPAISDKQCVIEILIPSIKLFIITLEAINGLHVEETCKMIGWWEKNIRKKWKTRESQKFHKSHFFHGEKAESWENRPSEMDECR